MFARVAAMRGRGTTTPAVTKTASTMTSLESVACISVAALKKKIDRGEVVVMDVRDIDSYTASLSPERCTSRFRNLETELPYLPRREVAYCT
jgi:hypothetical protein